MGAPSTPLGGHVGPSAVAPGVGMGGPLAEKVDRGPAQRDLDFPEGLQGGPYDPRGGGAWGLWGGDILSLSLGQRRGHEAQGRGSG